MTGRSGRVRIKSLRKGPGRPGLSSREEASVRLEPVLKLSETGSAEILPFQQVNAHELLSLLKRLQTHETSWSKVNPVFLPFIHPVSGLSTTLPNDVWFGLMEQLQPYIMPLNPISFEDPNTTLPGVTN